MKESSIVVLLTVFFIFLGIGGIYFDLFYSSFNFSEAELSIQNREVKETLHFKPDKDYHTLFRNFQDPLINTGNNYRLSQYIIADNIKCSNGNAYVNDYYSSCVFYPGKDKRTCWPYTEQNEYGCTFGSEYGFFEGYEYKIEADYVLNPENIFRIDGKYYLKFVVYSSGRHKLLTSNNFFTSPNVIRKKYYFPRDDVIVYIPFNESILDYQIKYQNGFMFDSSHYLISLLIFMLPAFLFFFTWFYFGREISNPDVPEQLSDYPVERKGWEVASYFMPPFSIPDKNFISTLMLEFYHRKIIDIKIKKKTFGKDIFLKLNSAKNLDKIEEKFYGMLKDLEDLSSEKDENDYFNFKRSYSSFSGSSKMAKELYEIKKLLKQESKKYITHTSEWIISVSYFISLFLALLTSRLIFIFFAIIYFFIVSWVYRKSAILISYKHDFYMEYRHWQSFRKWLSYSFAMTKSDHKAVVLWEKYLIYATALGVSEKVIKELKSSGLITDEQYFVYHNIIIGSNHFAAASGMKSSGGFSGAAGGGVGGGGGGGR